MASRMDRYYKAGERSKKNQDLYKQIGELDSYTNIEGVADISNITEINIDKVKEMLNKYNSSNQEEKHFEPIKTEETNLKKETEERCYDLNDVLNKAKHNHSEADARYRCISNKQYEMLKKMQEDNPENEELNELLNTISLENVANSNDLGMFDDLKSNTMVGEPASIKKILKEAKESEENKDTVEVEQVEHTNLDNLDRSFYTASFKFSDKDFEDLRNLDKNLRKNNKLIKILISSVIILVFIILVILLIKFGLK